MEDIKKYTVKQFAALQGVEERTVRRWIVKGAVDVDRTPGGGIRIIERRKDARPSVVIMTNADISGHSAT